MLKTWVEESTSSSSGGGSAGCALAGRLADGPGRRVLLLEAGPVELAAGAPRRRLAGRHRSGHTRELGVPGRAAPRAAAAAVPRGRVASAGPARSTARSGCGRPRRADGWDQPGWTWAGAARALRPRRERTSTSARAPGTATTARSGPPARPARCATRPRTGSCAAARPLRFPRRARQERRRPRRAPGWSRATPSTGCGSTRRWPTWGRDRAARIVDASGARARPGGAAVAASTATRAVGVELLDGRRSHGRARWCSPPAPSAPRTCCCGPGSARPTTCAPPASRSGSTCPASAAACPTTPPSSCPFTDADPPAHPHARGSPGRARPRCGADPAGDCEVLLFARPFVPDGPLHLMCAAAGTRTAAGRSRCLADPTGRPASPTATCAPSTTAAGCGTPSAPPPTCSAPESARGPSPDGEVLGTDRALDGWIAGAPHHRRSTCAAPRRWARRRRRSRAAGARARAAAGRRPVRAARSRPAAARPPPRSRSGEAAAEFLGARPSGAAG